MKSAFSILIISCLLALLPQVAGQASVKQEMSDEFLKGQFDWTFYLDVREVPSYLNYKGSRLHPLTRVRVFFRKYVRDAEGNNADLIKLYEDFWYCKGQVLGLRRHMPLKFESNQVGCMMLGASAGTADSGMPATDAMVRLLADLYLKNGVISAAIVPEAQFDEISTNLAHYNFLPQMSTSEGEQMTLHLQSNDGGRDEYLYLRK